jgi:hypothetical protein
METNCTSTPKACHNSCVSADGLAIVWPAIAARRKKKPAIQTVAKKATKDYVEAGQEPPIVRVATWDSFIIVDAN